MHGARRINFSDAFLHYVHFFPPDGFCRGNNLPVDVRLRNLVFIYNRYLPDTAPDQRLHNISADAPDTEHRHMLLRQRLHSVFSQKKPCSDKFFFHLFLHSEAQGISETAAFCQLSFSYSAIHIFSSLTKPNHHVLFIPRVTTNSRYKDNYSSICNPFFHSSLVTSSLSTTKPFSIIIVLA